MDAGGSPIPESINPNNFPAKLWRLVNNPANKAIHWDSDGEAIVIDQHLFERQVLCPSTIISDNADAFKTTNFSSFVRQLNLYGFRKVDPANKDSHNSGGDTGRFHYFCNPNFKRDHPELLTSLKRLTVGNKAKLQAGLSVTCQPPTRYQRFSGGGDGREKYVRRGSSSLLSPTHLESAHPYYLNKAQAMTVYNGTPVPPRYLIKNHGTALSPTVFATDKGLPVSLQHFAGVASSPNAAHIHEGLLAHANQANPNFAIFNPSNAQCQPGYCSPVFHCYQPNLVASHMTDSGPQTGSFSPQSFYQARYPVNMFCHGDHNQQPQEKEDQEVKKYDVNLDAVFQIADEVMQTSPSSCLVRIVTPEKPGDVLVPSSNTCNTMLSDSPEPMQANPVCAGTVLMTVSDEADLATYSQQEESVLSVPEQMPEDAICEVTSDDAKDTEVIDQVSNVFKVTSQAYNRTCTGSAPNV